MKAMLMIAFLATACSPINKTWVQERAVARWKEVGYEVIGYEGYQFGLTLSPMHGGAAVWYTLRRDANPDVIYTGYLKRWGDELHVYGPRAVDAVSANQ